MTVDEDTVYNSGQDLVVDESALEEIKVDESL